MTEKKNTKIAEKAAENITVSYQSLSNLNKDLSKLHSSEIKELRKLVSNIKKLFKRGDAPKKELEGIRKIYNKKYREHLQKMNKVFKL
tara:strand:+ start:235 stop:498 length:264 start_codon:yes stop_codon:yes gene_type:complete